MFIEAKRATEGEGTIRLTTFLQDFLSSKPHRRRRLVEQSIARFSSSFPCAEINTQYAKYTTQAIPNPSGYAEILIEYRGEIGIIANLRYAARKAAEKRPSWSGNNLDTPYVVSIENEEPGAVDDITIENAFYGPSGSGSTLRRVREFRNLSGVLVKNGTTFYYLHNPHSDSDIIPRRFQRFLPPSFRIPWASNFGGFL